VAFPPPYFVPRLNFLVKYALLRDSTYLGDPEKPQCSNCPCLHQFSFLSSLLNSIFRPPPPRRLHVSASCAPRRFSLYSLKSPAGLPARTSAFTLAFCSSAQILLRAAPLSATHFSDLLVAQLRTEERPLECYSFSKSPSLKTVSRLSSL
jgi:hypothetical protein